MKTLVLFALLGTLSVPTALDSSPTSEEKFVPQDLHQTTVLACYIGGNADGTKDVKAAAIYTNQRRTDVLIARETDMSAAIEDCRKWWHDVKEAWR